MRANGVFIHQAEWQRKYLRRLDQAEMIARRMGIGRDGIRAAFGHLWLPDSVGGYPPIGQYELYDVAGLLDIPEQGRARDATLVHSVLDPLLTQENEPPPFRLAPGETWP
jgi:hypothetical protein